MNKRIAIVGVGSIGSRHIDNLLAMGYADLVGIDSRPMPMDERLPILDSFEDLSPWNPTHALICTPPSLHYEHARYFLESGIPVFIEKPMTTKAYEAIALNELAKQASTYIGIGYMERAHPFIQYLKEWIAGQELSHSYIDCYWKAEKKTYDGDVAAESSHAIDIALHLFGDMKVESFYVLPRSCEVKLRRHDGFPCIITMDNNAIPLRRINICAKDAQKGFHWSSDYVQNGERYGSTKEEWDRCYKLELLAFLNGKPLCTGEDGIKVMNVLEQLK